MYKRSLRKKKKSEIFYSMTDRTKTYRKKIKRENKERRARNKKLITRFPWLAPLDWYGNRIKNKRFDSISLWDEVPSGWTNIFGKKMCEEIDESLVKSGVSRADVRVEQAKEKYGSLRLYMAVPTETQRIISIYEAISESVCAYCGRPHSPMMKFSWVIPMCEECFYKHQKQNEYFYQGPYEKYTPPKEQWDIPPVLKWKKFSSDKEAEIIKEDITDRIKAIELNYQKQQERRLKRCKEKV